MQFKVPGCLHFISKELIAYGFLSAPESAALLSLSILFYYQRSFLIHG